MDNQSTKAAKSSGFFKIPRLLAKRKDLTATEKLVAAALMNHGRQKSPIFPSQNVVAEETGLTVRTIRGAIRALEERGEFKVKRVGKRCTNRYLPSLNLAKTFDYGGLTNETAPVDDRKNLPVNPAKLAGHPGKFFRSNSNRAKEEKNRTAAPIGADHTEAMFVLADEQDSFEVSGRDCLSLPSLEFVESDRLTSVLRSWGLGTNTAQDIVRKHEEREVRLQILYLPFRRPQSNPAGFLRKAIEDDYSEPKLTEAEGAWIKGALDSGMLPMPTSDQRVASAKNLDGWKDRKLQECETFWDQHYSSNGTKTCPEDVISEISEDEVPF